MKWSASPRNRALSEPHGRSPCDWGIRADKILSPTEALCTAPYRLRLVQRLCFPSLALQSLLKQRKNNCDRITGKD